MRSFLPAIVVALLTATSAHARPFAADWVQNRPARDGSSCVATCARQGGDAIASGEITAASDGDPSLYVCKAFVPGIEFYGARAGYNWNGSIGNNYQPGCTVVGGAGGYTHVANFQCLCEVRLNVR